MLVHELIEALNAMPKDLPVGYPEGEFGDWYDIESVRMTEAYEWDAVARTTTRTPAVEVRGL